MKSTLTDEFLALTGSGIILAFIKYLTNIFGKKSKASKIAMERSELVAKEILGWEDPVTHEVHPPLRATIDSLTLRMTAVEADTAQLRKNGGSHLADAIRQMQIDLARVVGIQEATTPKKRSTTPKTKP